MKGKKVYKVVSYRQGSEPQQSTGFPTQKDASKFAAGLAAAGRCDSVNLVECEYEFDQFLAGIDDALERALITIGDGEWRDGSTSDKVLEGIDYLRKIRRRIERYRKGE